MNEFEGKTKVQLEAIKIGLEGYMQGNMDLMKMIEEYYEKTIYFMNEKLNMCQTELDKVENANSK